VRAGSEVESTCCFVRTGVGVEDRRTDVLFFLASFKALLCLEMVVVHKKMYTRGRGEWRMEGKRGGCEGAAQMKIKSMKRTRHTKGG